MKNGTSSVSRVEELFVSLREHDFTLATAESCTGGLVGGKITSVPGSSAYYAGGIIAYANRIKISRLEVQESLLADRGAVSGEVAEAMARGAANLLDTELALSTTGIAGPGGGTEEKPVGLVYSAVFSPQGSEVSENNFTGSRREIRQKTVDNLLELACGHLSSIKNAK